MKRKQPAILLGPHHSAAIKRLIERVVCGAAFDPVFALLYISGPPSQRSRLFAELYFDPLRPLWVRAQPPERGMWLGRGGRRHACLTYDEEREAFLDLEARADAGEALDVRAMVSILSARCGEPVTVSAVEGMLARQGFVRVGQKPLWVRRREAVERRLGHLRQLEREAKAKTEAPGPLVQSAAPEEGSAGCPQPAPAPVVPSGAAAVVASVLRAENHDPP